MTTCHGKAGQWVVLRVRQVAGAIPLTVAFDRPAGAALDLSGGHFAPSHAAVALIEGTSDFEGTSARAGFR